MLLDIFDAFQFFREVLIGRLKLKVRFKVHFAMMLGYLSSYHLVHFLTLYPVFLLFILEPRQLVAFLKVLELHFLLKDRSIVFDLKLPMFVAVCSNVFLIVLIRRLKRLLLI